MKPAAENSPTVQAGVKKNIYKVFCKGCETEILCTGFLPHNTTFSKGDDYPGKLAVCFRNDSMLTVFRVIKIDDEKVCKHKRICEMQCINCDKVIGTLMIRLESENRRTSTLKSRKPCKTVTMKKLTAEDCAGKKRVVGTCCNGNEEAGGEKEEC